MDRQTILSLTVNDLKQKLNELNLTTTGKKIELQNRLIQHYELPEQSCPSESDSEYVETESPHRPRTEYTVHRSLFTLRDIIESLNYYDGSGQPSLEQWIDNFEINALAVNWDEVQKFIYAKQLLKGAALLFVRSQTDINSWTKLKRALTKEFSIKLSTVDIHRMLSNTCKKSNEPYLEFLYRILDIAKGSNVDEKSIIEYYIDGLKGSQINKTMLYEAETVDQLKHKIKIYEKIQNKQETEKRKCDNNFKKCHRCPHLNNHSADQCKKIDVCQNCNKKGHKTHECRTRNLNYAKPNHYEQNNNRGNKQDTFIEGNRTNNKYHSNSQHNNNNSQHNNNNSQHNFNNHSNSQFNYNNRNNSKSGNPRNSGNNESENHANNRINDYNCNPQTNVCSTAIRIYKTVQIGERKFSALLDTGSDVCLMTKSLYDSLKDVLFFDEKISISGIGEGKMKTYGYFITKLQIDNIEFSWTFHVVNDNDIIAQSIIGNDILKVLNINISSEGATFELKENAKTKLINKTEKRAEDNEIFTLGIEFENICLNAFELEKENYSYLSSNNRNKLFNLISSYKPNKIMESPVKFNIILTDETPIYDRPRRLPISDQKIVEQQINEWLENKIIKTSNSDFAAPIVLASKKNGGKRLCCDYRKINEKIIKDNFPMAIIDDILLKLQNAKIFSTLDLKNGFFHVAVEENSQKYTSFITHHGQFEFLRTPFGMKNSPAIFCRFIAQIFHKLMQEGTVIIYMDDIVIPSQTEEENIDKLSQVLEIASSYGLEINLEKCQFLKTEICFLGYRIKNSSIQPSEEKTKAVAYFKEPTTIKSLQRFLGLTSFFRRFIENYAVRARPLTMLLSKNAKFAIKEEQRIAIEDLKQALVNAPVLKIFNPNAETEVHTDASSHGYGAVLLQKCSEDQNFHPVEYMSRKTSVPEEKYHSFELEVLAIIKALKKWRMYLLGISFRIITDCNAFTQTIKKRDVPAKIERWIIFLQDFNYTTEHRPSSRLRHADALSRVHCLMIQSSLKHNIIQNQKSDDNIAIIRKLLETQTYKDYYIKNDILYKNPSKDQIVIPLSLEKEIIELAHKQGHFGKKKTADIIQKNFYIKDLESKIEKCIKNCIECILVNRKEGKKEGLLHPIDKADRPLHTFHLDHVGPMDTTKKMYNYILTIVDAFSKFVWIFPTKSTTAEEVIDRMTKIASTFGYPERVITDRGGAFVANSFKVFCQENSIEHVLTTTGVPQGNGQVERVHKIIISILSKMCVNNKNCWYKYVGQVQQFMNNTATRSTKMAPFRLLTGLDMKIPKNINFQDIIEQEILQELQEEKDQLRQIAKANIQKIQNENKKYFDRNRKQETNYDVNELVAIKRTQFGTGLKLKPDYLGPYKVKSKKSMGRYSVEKVGEHEGPNSTLTTAEFMKKWHDSGSNHLSGGPNVGSS